jgi:hypothetical protein
MIGALRRQWPDVVDALDEVRGSQRVTGVIISREFEKLGHDARQRKLWRILNKALTSDELSQVGPIATLSPAEVTVFSGPPPTL